MKNIYGKTVTPQYEVCLEYQRGTTECPDWSLDESNTEVTNNYRDAVKMAKKLSLEHTDETKERIYICCFFEDEISTYNMAWWEYYINGKKECRILNEPI